MLQLEHNYSALMYQMNQTEQPMLFSIKIIQDLYYVLLSMHDLHNTEKSKYRHQTTQYLCNGVPGGKKITILHSLPLSTVSRIRHTVVLTSLLLIAILILICVIAIIVIAVQ
mmetsp:Transcript_8327/g.8161  ORF Transcript_8327/g.8161 Transcript_8327/m.8161 type:complete len:112 (+) Transcript_8327:103-438(+)